MSKAEIDAGKSYSFQYIVENGYALDGGLFVPIEFPSFSIEEMKDLYKLY